MSLDTHLATALGSILSGLAVGSAIDTTSRAFRDDIAVDLEFFVPALFRPEHEFWASESLDEFRFALARKTGPLAAEFVGLALLIGQQQWIAIDLALAIAPDCAGFNAISCKLGEPGEGRGGLRTIPYSSPDVPLVLADVKERRHHMKWVYQTDRIIRRP